MTRPVFRFAPSPNGRLHLGHAASALLNEKLAHESNGRLLLRMEDTDVTRCRAEFADGIFDDLAWLGIAWETPVRVQSEHFDDYEKAIDTLWSMGSVYPCFCSRREAAAHALPAHDPDGQPHYGGTCRNLPLKVARARIAAGEIHGWRINMNDMRDDAASIWGDVMIAKRHVGSSYHIAVVTDDALQGVTHVVRGMDMEPATPIHTLLQRLLGFPAPVYMHHPLILDDEGRKLSKSLNSTSLAGLRAMGETPASIRQRLGFT